MQVVAAVANIPPASAGDIRDAAWIPGSGRSRGGDNGSPLQHSCLENPVDGGAWWATVRGVAKSQTRPSDFTLCQEKKVWHLVRAHFMAGIRVPRALAFSCQEMTVFVPKESPRMGFQASRGLGAGGPRVLPCR